MRVYILIRQKFIKSAQKLWILASFCGHTVLPDTSFFKSKLDASTVLSIWDTEEDWKS